MKNNNYFAEERIKKLIEMIANEKRSKNLEDLGIVRSNVINKTSDKFQIFYQSRLHTFYNRNVSFDEFSKKCTPLFSFKKLYKDKRYLYYVNIIDVSKLYSSIGYVVMYAIIPARNGNINSPINGYEYKFISYKKDSAVARALNSWND